MNRRIRTLDVFAAAYVRVDRMKERLSISQRKEARGTRLDAEEGTQSRGSADEQPDMFLRCSIGHGTKERPCLYAPYHRLDVGRHEGKIDISSGVSRRAPQKKKKTVNLLLTPKPGRSEQGQRRCRYFHSLISLIFD
jgi:hypothetical protein